MWLGKAKKLRKLYINHQLLKMDFPNSIDKDELEQLVILLRTKSETLSFEELNEIKQKIIFAHIRLTISIVGRYAFQAKNSINDLVSEALFALTQAVENAKDKLYDNNITPYIVGQVHSFVNKFIIHNHTIQLKVKDLNLRNIIVLNDEEWNNLVDPDSETDISNLEQTLDIVLDSDKSSHKDLKRKIIYLRKLNYTDSEIGQILKISQQFVQQLRADVARRFKYLIEKDQ